MAAFAPDADIEAFDGEAGDVVMSVDEERAAMHAAHLFVAHRRGNRDRRQEAGDG